eukprot:12104646-Heterocapsa_arctica.AAC.1
MKRPFQSVQHTLVTVVPAGILARSLSSPGSTADTRTRVSMGLLRRTGTFLWKTNRLMRLVIPNSCSALWQMTLRDWNYDPTTPRLPNELVDNPDFASCPP